MTNREPLICIKDCYSIENGYCIKKGEIFYQYKSDDFNLFDGQILSWEISFIHSKLSFMSHNFMKLSEYRDNQINQILT